MAMKRTKYDLTSLVFQVLKTGRLQTLQQIPVNAGDSISLSAGVLSTLTPLRRRNVVQPEMLLGAFFVPHRHVYSNWVDYLTDGLNESETLSSWANPSAQHSINFLGQTIPVNTSVPAHIKYSYSQVYRRYFRYPNNDTHFRGSLSGSPSVISDIGVVDDDEVQESNKDTFDYGYRCVHLPTVWNSSLASYGLEDEDREATTTNSKLDLAQLEQAKAKFGNLQAREFWASTDRYKDVLKLVYGTGQVNIDADQRPELLATTRYYIGGQDVAATDTSSIGKQVGIGQDASVFGFPRKFFPEHGTIITLALMRYPQLFYNEVQPLNKIINPEYKLFGGDPGIISHEPPVDIDGSDYFSQLASASIIGKIPYGQEWRSLPQAVIHEQYNNVTGFPFYRSDRSPIYIGSNDYDSIFQTSQLGHCQVSGKFRWDIKRLIPPAKSSVMVGAPGR